MKKIIFLSTCIFVSLLAHGTTHIVHVANFSFSPATVNAIVGDTMTWIWDNGGHTTTSTSVPAGAATWNSPINATSTSFSYKITVAGTYQYWCTIHQPNMAGTINVSGSLPVVLTNFTVSASSGNSALLTWNTATEINTADFSIQRSEDGKNFIKIAAIPAAGNSSNPQSYKYLDNQLNTKNKYFYYMLEIVDKDGKKSLSEIIMFRNNGAQDKLITQISPNPVHRPGHLMLQFNADKAGEMLVQIFDVNGKLVQETQMSSVPGVNNGHLHISNLATGVYNIVFTLDKVSEKYKVVVQ